MANDDHVALLKQGVDAWNAWRDENPNITPHLFKANLGGADLRRANLSTTDLSRADLRGVNLRGASLSDANLRDAKLRDANLTDAYVSGADLGGADLRGAYFGGTNFSGADLSGADLRGANLRDANLRDANLGGADLSGANLSDANLSMAYLSRANLSKANLSGADLRVADLQSTILTGTDFSGADLAGCRIYGISAWSLKLERSKQRNLIITPETEPEITVDNIEVAQFIYLMLHNQKVREVIDTITSKVVLILGRFTDERRAVLDALREELRERNYLPILFDFEKPRNRDTDETITLLARMARFIVADVSDAKSVLQELRGIVPDLPSVPVQSIILAGQAEPGMFDFYRNMKSFLPVHRYDDQEQLLADLRDKVIRPAEEKVLELRG